MRSSLKCKFYKIYQNKLLFLAVVSAEAAAVAVAINSHIFASIALTSIGTYQIVCPLYKLPTMKNLSVTSKILECDPQ